MHPILFHLGRLAIPTDGVLVAFGLLAGLQLASLVAPRCGLVPDRVWNLGLISLLALFLGQRMLVILFNLRDFLDHPIWMLGLTEVRDERYFYGGALLALGAGAGYITAWRLRWLAVLDSLAPGAGLALACLSFGSLAAGADFGRATTAHWGIVYTSRVAARTAGTPLGIPLIPVALYAGLLYLVAASVAAWLVLRASFPGAGSGFWLFTAGLGTVLLEQLRYPQPGEPLVLGCLTPVQALGAAAVILACVLWLRPGPKVPAVLRA